MTVMAVAFVGKAVSVKSSTTPSGSAPVKMPEGTALNCAPLGLGSVGAVPPVAVGTGVWGKKILTGPVVLKTGPWDAKVEGGMVRAFFDKEQTFKDAAKAKGPELPKLTKERETEQALLAEWFGLPDDARKKAYDTDNWAIPDALATRPLTTEFKAGAAVKVKSLLVARCAVCHAG